MISFAARKVPAAGLACFGLSHRSGSEPFPTAGASRGGSPDLSPSASAVSAARDSGLASPCTVSFTIAFSMTISIRGGPSAPRRDPEDGGGAEIGWCRHHRQRSWSASLVLCDLVRGPVSVSVCLDAHSASLDGTVCPAPILEAL